MELNAFVAMIVCGCCARSLRCVRGFQDAQTSRSLLFWDIRARVISKAARNRSRLRPATRSQNRDRMPRPRIVERTLDVTARHPFCLITSRRHLSLMVIAIGLAIAIRQRQRAAACLVA